MVRVGGGWQDLDEYLSEARAKFFHRYVRCAPSTTRAEWYRGSIDTLENTTSGSATTCISLVRRGNQVAVGFDYNFRLSRSIICTWMAAEWEQRDLSTHGNKLKSLSSFPAMKCASDLVLASLRHRHRSVDDAKVQWAVSHEESYLGESGALAARVTTYREEHHSEEHWSEEHFSEEHATFTRKVTQSNSGTGSTAE